MKTYYELLEVDFGADQTTIRKAYLKKSLQHHPDKNPDRPEEAKARFMEIGAAYETLSDPAKRRLYDQELQGGRRRSDAFGAAGAGGGDPWRAAFDSRDYDSYRDVFDATVAGMSEAELAAAVGTIAAVAGVVGSIVGSRLLSGRSGCNGQRGGGSSFMSAAGSMIGSMVASELAASSVRALHQESIQRISYQGECRRAVERGEPMPHPPTSSNWGKLVENTLKTVKNVTQQGSNDHSQSAFKRSR